MIWLLLGLGVKAVGCIIGIRMACVGGSAFITRRTNPGYDYTDGGNGAFRIDGVRIPMSVRISGLAAAIIGIIVLSLLLPSMWHAGVEILQRLSPMGGLFFIVPKRTGQDDVPTILWSNME